MTHFAYLQREWLGVYEAAQAKGRGRGCTLTRAPPAFTLAGRWSWPSPFTDLTPGGRMGCSLRCTWMSTRSCRSPSGRRAYCGLECLADPVVDHEPLLLEPQATRGQVAHERGRSADVEVCGPGRAQAVAVDEFGPEGGNEPAQIRAALA